MSDALAPRPRRARRMRMVAVSLLLLLAVVAGTAPWWFDARRVATLALAQADATTGLDWSFEGEPALRWRPQPWLALPRLTARDTRGRTVLSAERLELALPWATLRGESVRIEALAIAGPDIDLDAAIDWWNAQPPGDGALPVLDGVRITDGRLRWSGGVVEAIDLSLPRFAVDEPMRAEFSGRVALSGSGDAASIPPPAAFTAEMTLEATPRTAPLRLDPLQLAMSGTGPVPQAVAEGAWTSAPWALELDGELASWPAAWPALPPPLADSDTPIAFTLMQSGESALVAPASITLRRDEARVDTTFVPEAVLAWLDDEAAAALPPLQARATLPRVDIDGVVLEGVTVELGDDAESSQ